MSRAGRADVALSQVGNVDVAGLQSVLVKQGFIDMSVDRSTPNIPKQQKHRMKIVLYRLHL